ncbi:Palmitoyltransferase zdhhc13 [Rhizophlyctis rosea]|uniref:Palmitoyltransferase zdhhc13 n=1 Tax=Rhizophlyctis rosea TaxID=64517 RepID=A0AAD5S7H6_9FUNG|nr:Palmitoyltransferase zdhhc13 [Rhizophlyctis rosea]
MSSNQNLNDRTSGLRSRVGSIQTLSNSFSRGRPVTAGSVMDLSGRLKRGRSQSTLRDLGGGKKKELGKVGGKVIKTVGMREVGLFKACHKGDLDEVYRFLWQNANINCKKPVYGSSPLSIACRQGHIRVASTLIESGANPVETDGYGVTPLHWATLSQRPDLVSYLLSKIVTLQPPPIPRPKPPPTAPAADDPLRERERELPRSPYLDLVDKTWIDKRDMFGSTPLHFASVVGDERVVQVLVQAGCDPTIVNNDGRKPKEEQKTIQTRLLSQRALRKRPTSSGKKRKTKSASATSSLTKSRTKSAKSSTTGLSRTRSKSKSKGSVSGLAATAKSRPARTTANAGKDSAKLEEASGASAIGKGGAPRESVGSTGSGSAVAKLTGVGGSKSAGGESGSMTRLGSARPSTARRSDEKLAQGSMESLKKSGSGEARGLVDQEVGKRMTAGPRGFVSAVGGTKGVGV